MDNTYTYPLLPLGREVYVLFPSDKTVVAAFNPDDSGQLIFYLFMNDGFLELTRSPVRYKTYIYYAYVSGDKIALKGPKTKTPFILKVTF